MDLAWFVLKALLGTGLFALILWVAQSQQPRAAGMMLTFPAMNGIGLLAAEGRDLHLMATAMCPLIATNGLTCALYILGQRWLMPGLTQRYRRLAAPGLLFSCLGVWLAMALCLSLPLQAWLIRPGNLALSGLGYTLGAVMLTWLFLWIPTDGAAGVRQSLPGVMRTNAVKLGVLTTLLVLIMLCASVGAEAWAGRLSTFPLLPLYSLLMLSDHVSAPQRRGTTLKQLGSTVLFGPLVAMAFVWAFVHYLNILRQQTQGVLYVSSGLVGLLALWGVCGMLIWALLRLASAVEKCLPARTTSEAVW